ncbi:AAA+ ATPase domain-containing protein [Tanacetum coccineum]
MADGEVFRVSSARISTSSIWRNSGRDFFSRSSHEEDDEEALKWAAIEKLPTNLRLERGILTEEKGCSKEIDIKNLGLVEKRNLLDRLVRIAEEDNDKFLLKLKERIDRVGLKLPTIEVRFEHLNVDAEAYVGGRALPTIINFVVNILEGSLNYLHLLPSRKKSLPILHDVSGIVKPGRSNKMWKIFQKWWQESCQVREKEANIKPDPDLDLYMKAASMEGQEASVVTEYVMKILGLEVCADTVVGDEMFRGISGGQKKRVTTGEMMVGPSRALFMDEISTGLDSSTTFQIVNSIRQSIHILEGTCVISLLQPAPETYNLFDDVILLSDGQVVYQGPLENVLEFFDYMGFKCPERKAVADFLQEVTSKKDQEQYWVRTNEPYSFVTVQEFAEAFQLFHVGRKLGDELAAPFDRAKSHHAALTTKKYGVSRKELLKACVSREYLLMKRNSFVYIFKMTQLGLSIIKLPVFYKQRDLLFFPAWIYSLPTWILKIPVTFVEVATWIIMTYYVVGFDPDVGRFFRQLLLFICIHQMASALFRFMAALGRNIIVANTFASLALLAIMVLEVDLLPLFTSDDIKKWWAWGYWISPLMYGQNGMAVNEFLGKSWNQILPNSTETLGVAVLKSRGLFTEAKWYWICVAFGKPQAVLSEETLAARNAIKIQENVYGDTKNEVRTSVSSRSMSSRVATITEADKKPKRGMVLPFVPLSLTFDEIRYAVDMPQEMKAQGVKQDKLELLKDVSGCFRPGVLTALMGISGAGKTTLMDVLAGRKTGGYTEGRISISGYPKKQETYARIAGYCEQTDIHSPHVTVSESLQYSSWLRLPPEVDSATRKMFIKEVMELVELTPLSEALVGLPGVNGLSTEQRKRLTIAVELVANPSIIFMDEPTSGLDARAAAIVMRTVRNTVDTGRTVVCTIHQPSIDIFDAFDELFLLKRGGEEIYFGPLGRHCAHLIKYFEDINGVNKIKDGYNPATWMLEVTSGAQESALGVNFAEIYKSSELYKRNKELIREHSQPVPGSYDIHFRTQYSQSFWTQCMACLWKQYWSYWRNPQYTAVRFLFTTFIAFMFGTIFWDMGSKREKTQDLFNAMGSMYAAVTFIGVQNAVTVQPVVSIERTVFYRERAAGMYSAFPYAFGQVMIEIPYIFVQTIVYGIIVYAMIGYEWTVVKFFWHLFFIYFSLLYFTFYGMMTVAVTPNHNIAAIISSAFFAIWNLFSGFIIPRTVSGLHPVYVCL